MRLSVHRVIFAVTFSMACLLQQSALAQTLKSVELEDLTWTELRAALRAGCTTAIIPIGGTEQSGPYIALGKHNARVRVLARRIAQELGNAVVAPVIAYVPEGRIDPPTSHMRFPGTLTIPDDAFETVLESAARSLETHGFKRIIFLGDHGGYQADIRQVVARLNQAWHGTAARAYAPVEYYAASSRGYAAILRGQGIPDAEIGTHAGLADTSLQLATAPDMVRLNELHSAPRPGAADGVYGGDPRRASAALGQLGVEAIVSRTVAAIRREQNAR